MTYNDIVKKFLIQYDKDDNTSSYPSLTTYEIATILDKAYLALIAQKLTGNNTRGVPFEGDIKAIEDIRPLLKTSEEIKPTTVKIPAKAHNELVFGLPEGLMYFIQALLETWPTSNNITNDKLESKNVILINHQDAMAFKSTLNNIPWIENPVAYIEGTYIHVLVDPIEYKNAYKNTSYLHVTFIQQPTTFVSSIDNLSSTDFQLNDTMAEELINLAIIMALDNVESTRLNTKVGLQKLEA